MYAFAIGHASQSARTNADRATHGSSSVPRVEPALPPWQGDRLPLHHGRFEFHSDCQIATKVGFRASHKSVKHSRPSVPASNSLIVDWPLCLRETPAPFTSRSPDIATLGPSSQFVGYCHWARLPEHRAGLEPASPLYESGVLAARRPVLSKFSVFSFQCSVRQRILKTEH